MHSILFPFEHTYDFNHLIIESQPPVENSYYAPNQINFVAIRLF